MKKWISVLLGLGLGVTALHAQSLESGVTFNYFFDNLEYGDGSRNTGYDAAGTINAFRLTPRAALRLDHGSTVHRLNMGLDVMKDMGSGVENRGLLRELTAWYSADAELSNSGHFSAAAGIFPRSFSEGDYGKPFLDESVRFYDPNLEGMFFKYRTDRLYAELGLDWMGQYGGGGDPARRERFQILSSGRWAFADRLQLRWAMTMYHFANSPVTRGVVDNDLLNPMLHWTPASGLDVLDLGFGGLLTYQFDRIVDDLRVSGGLFLRQRVEKSHIGLDNSFYLGGDLMPFYAKYGSALYWGEECYHTQVDGAGWCDQASFYYAPEIAPWVDLVVAFQFHFGGAETFFRGWQQMVSLRFNIEKKI